MVVGKRGDYEGGGMNARVSRRLRRSAYGKGMHPGPVTYYRGNKRAKNMPRNLHGCLIADQKRRDYQALKKAYKEGQFSL